MKPKPYSHWKYFAVKNYTSLHNFDMFARAPYKFAQVLSLAFNGSTHANIQHVGSTCGCRKLRILAVMLCMAGTQG